MIVKVARNRMVSVTMPDSISISREDFFATHMPLNNIIELDSFEESPTSKIYSNEEQIFQKYIVNSKDRYRFITVYGESGTGKSHLIRWLNEKYINVKPQSEVVLFISRNDNTLKGTIRQLLAMPEVQNIENKELFDNLAKASVSIDEAKLKEMIYQQFWPEINHDKKADEEKSVKLSSLIRPNLIPFLKNDDVQKKLMESNGPIDRIFGKVAEQSIVDRDLEAKFYKEDFFVSQDLYDQMIEHGADRGATDLARKLKGIHMEKTAQSIADFMNQYVNAVILYCTGIKPGNFKDLFTEIRKSLKKEGKNLTLFIEDITSFTGVNLELLDALMELETGVTEAKEMCRVSSIVGTTSSFLRNQFLDNHKDRVNKYLYIPMNQFTNERLYEFVGRYLNAMSLEVETIKSWIDKGALTMEYPVAEIEEGKNWDSIEIANNKVLNLYPFTKKAIENLYQIRLVNHSKTTPRYIISNIIMPVVSEIISNKSAFPSENYKSSISNPTINFAISNKATNEETVVRLSNFIYIWGNAEPNSYILNGEKYTCGIKNALYEELGLPILNFDLTSYVPEDKTKEPIKQGKDVSTPKKESKITDAALENVSGADTLLLEWRNGAKLDLSKTNGACNTIRYARDDLISYIITGINWQVEGMDMDLRSKIVNAGIKLITLENLSRNIKGLYTLPANLETHNLILAFARYREYGKTSWNYEGSGLDVYLITLWMFKHKQEIIKAIELYDNKKVDYMSYSIAAEIYRLIFNGEFREKNFAKLNMEYFFKDNNAKGKSEKTHSKAWNSMIDKMSNQSKGLNNKESIQTAFNIIQGTGSTRKIVINEPSFKKKLRSVKTNMFNDDFDDHICLEDPIKQRREVFEYYISLKKDVINVLNSEKNYVLDNIKVILEAFDNEDEIDDTDLEDLLDEIENFYKEANNTLINVITPDLSPIKNRITFIVRAYNSIVESKDSDDILENLLTFSSNPMEYLNPLKELVEKVNSDLVKVDNDLIVKERNADEIIKKSGAYSYDDEVEILKQCNEFLFKVGE